MQTFGFDLNECWCSKARLFVLWFLSVNLFLDLNQIRKTTTLTILLDYSPSHILLYILWSSSLITINILTSLMIFSIKRHKGFIIPCSAYYDSLYSSKSLRTRELTDQKSIMQINNQYFLQHEALRSLTKEFRCATTRPCCSQKYSATVSSLWQRIH